MNSHPGYYAKLRKFLSESTSIICSINQERMIRLFDQTKMVSTIPVGVSKALHFVNPTRYTRLNINESCWWLYNSGVIYMHNEFLAKITIKLANNDYLTNINFYKFVIKKFLPICTIIQLVIPIAKILSKHGI